MKGFLLFLVLLLMAASNNEAQEKSKGSRLKKKVDGTIEVQRRIQKNRDEWAEEKSELQARYRTARSNVEYLAKRKENVQKEYHALMERTAELERRLEESDRLENSLQDTLSAVLEKMEVQVGRDLPFLIDERRSRVEMLKTEIVKPDVTGAEKLRKLLEALQIEANYGQNVEVYQQKIELGGDTLFVDVLHIGRVSVFWKTPDGEMVGSFDPASRSWVLLSDKYNRPISEAMEMASRIRPVELIELPLGRLSDD